MIPLFYIDTISKSPIYKTPPESFWNLLKETIDKVAEQFPESPRLIQAESINKLIIAYAILPLNEFNERFTHFKEIALRFPRDPSTLWGTISIGVLTPDLEEAYLKSLPSPYRDKHQINPGTTPAPQKITPQTTPTPKKKHPNKRGELWKLDARWDHLWPSSRKTFTELCRRAQKPKKPFAFPWCQAGIPSLVKFTGVSEHQVRRALGQLQNYSLIKRIVRGYEGTRGSKYYVFLTPKMSGAFYFTTRQAKNQRPQKKRSTRIR